MTRFLGWFLCLASFPLHAAVWNIDAGHSTARFKVRHMMVSNVSGEIGGIKGTFDVDEKDMAKTKAEATLDVATINTNNAKRDDHLKTAEFFDVAKHPSIAFKSKKWMKAGAKWKLTGDLTMHGVTKEVTLSVDDFTKPVKDPWGNQRRGFVAMTKVERKDFGITWNKNLDGGGLVLGETVDVTIEFEMTMPSESKAG